MKLLGQDVVGQDDLGRSHAWTLHRAWLADGREVFVKRGADFAAEAAGLTWLGAPAVEVLYEGEGLLVLPWLPPERPTPALAETFGRDLAAVHGAGAPSFGAPWPGFIAELPLDNTPDDTWASWYAERRVLPYARMAFDRGVLTDRDVRRIEEKMSGLSDLGEPPSRIHGDLWSGNVHWSGGRARLIDPAAHGGHRETDLAMLALFGAPHLDRILAAYAEAAPPAPGWRDRVALHQLHPLLVHCVLYGASYREQTLRALEKA
ncbi:MAG: fructosamine kinase family protein [Streptosporangiaceae bacterium]